MDESRRSRAERSVRVADGRHSPSESRRFATRPPCILVSDRPDLHVLMLERTRRAVFGPGRDGVSRAARSIPATRTRDSPTGRRPRRSQPRAPSRASPAGGLAFRVAAVRECFEEAGHPAGRATRRPGGRSSTTTRSRPTRRELNAGDARVRRRARGARPRARRPRAARCSRTGSRRSARPVATTRGSSSRRHPTAKTAPTTTTSSSRRSGCARSTRSRSTPPARSISSSRPR